MFCGMTGLGLSGLWNDMLRVVFLWNDMFRVKCFVE